MKKNAGLWIIIGLVVVAVGLVFASKALNQAPPSEELVAKLAVTPTDHVRGAENSSVVVVEYLDFECPSCAAYYPIVKKMEEEFGDRVTFVVRHFPLPSHPNSLVAAVAAEAAGEQGKFWEMHDILFERQKEWSGTGKNAKEFFANYAAEIGLDTEKFRTDSESSELGVKVRDSRDLGFDLKVAGTPTFFLNGTKLENLGSEESFRAALNAALAPATTTQPS